MNRPQLPKRLMSPLWRAKNYIDLNAGMADPAKVARKERERSEPTTTVAETTIVRVGGVGGGGGGGGGGDLTQAAADLRYLKLAADNDPLTGALTVDIGLTVNETGADADTRVEGDTDTYLLFVDASTDRVGIGTAAPTTKLHVVGAVTIHGTAPVLNWYESDAATDEKYWRITQIAGVWYLNAVNDAYSGESTAMLFDRTGQTPSAPTFPGLAGTGTRMVTTTAAGLLGAAAFDPDLATFTLPASTTISAFGATLTDDADATTARTTLGLTQGVYNYGTATIAAGVLTLTAPPPDTQIARVLVETEASAATDNLDIITMTSPVQGMLLVLSSVSNTRDSTVRDAILLGGGSNNILLADGGTSHTLVTTDSHIILQYRTTTAPAWVEVSRYPDAGGLTEAAADVRYVNVTGDTMTGDLSAANVYATTYSRAGYAMIAPNMSAEGVQPAFVLNDTSGAADAKVYRLHNAAGSLMLQAINDAYSVANNIWRVDKSGATPTKFTVNNDALDLDTQIKGDTDANLVYVDASTDRVGIGTASPTDKLNVVGTARVKGLASVSASLAIDSVGATQAELWLARDAAPKWAFYNTASDVLAIYNGARNVLEIAQGNGAPNFNPAGADQDFQIQGDTVVPLFFVDASTDRVGIGLNNPQHKLTVQGGFEIRNTGSETYFNYTGAGNNYIRGGLTYIDTHLVFNDAGGDLDARFKGDTDAALLYTDASTDRVGIGTATPSQKLDVQGSIFALGEVVFNTSTGEKLGLFGTGGYAIGVEPSELRLSTSGDATIRTGGYTGTERVRVTPTGVTLQSLAGTGTRMVTASAAGLLGTAALGAAAAGGADTQVNFNDAGVLQGDSGLVYNKTTDVLTVGGGITMLGGLLSVTGDTAISGPTTVSSSITIGGTIQQANAAPQQLYGENDAALDEKWWLNRINGGLLEYMTLDDASTVTTTWLSANRNGNRIDLISLNAGGLDTDVQIKGDTDDNLLYLDASTDRVGIGTATPAYKLDVNGQAAINGTVAEYARFRLAATGSAIGPAISNFFGANSAFVTEASSLYLVEAHCYFTKTTAGTVLWTLTSSTSMTAATLGFASGPLTGSAGVSAAATTVATLASGSLTTGVNHYMVVRGVVESNTAGNVRLNVTSSAGTVTPLRGSRYTVQKIGSANIGSFSA